MPDAGGSVISACSSASKTTLAPAIPFTAGLPWSYVLMDTAYAQLDIPFDQAFSVLSTVLSRPRREQCATDAGLKANAVDHGNPSVKGIDGAQVLFLSDEHASIALPAACELRPGDRLELWPSHVDPTINLHDVMYALDGEEVVETWPVAARGYTEQRAQ